MSFSVTPTKMSDTSGATPKVFKAPRTTMDHKALDEHHGPLFEGTHRLSTDIHDMDSSQQVSAKSKSKGTSHLRYQRCLITGDEDQPGAKPACQSILKAIKLREKYLFLPEKIPGKPKVSANTDSGEEGGEKKSALSAWANLPRDASQDFALSCVNGVFKIDILQCPPMNGRKKPEKMVIEPPATFPEFVADYDMIRNISTFYRF